MRIKLDSNRKAARLSTGNPKPCVVRNGKLNSYGVAILAVNLREQDKVYAMLPMYHTSGQLGFCGCIITGCKWRGKQK